MDGHDKSLWAGSFAGWMGWAFSHLREVNDLLLTSIAATVAAFIYHRSRTKR